MTLYLLWIGAGFIIIVCYLYQLYSNDERWNQRRMIQQQPAPFYTKTMVLMPLCLLLCSFPAYSILAQATTTSTYTTTSITKSSASVLSSPSSTATYVTDTASPVLATNDLVPGVTDAATDALTKAKIQSQNQTASKMMNEQAMMPKIEKNGTKQFVLTAAPLVWNLYEQKNINAWGYNGQISGPLLRVTVGDTISIVLNNHLPVPTSLGFSGLSLPAKLSGVRTYQVAPHASYTYTFKITSDMVGTHSYFSTTDMDKQINHGLHGVLLVDPAQGKEYPDADVNALFDIGSFVVDQKVEENVFTLNGKPYPNSPELSIQQGQRVLIRIVNSSADSFHAMHLHGYTFTLVAQDGHHLDQPISMNVVSVAPEETVDIEFTANAPGTWMFHCHILDHTMNPDDDNDEMGGLMTNFVVHGKGSSDNAPLSMGTDHPEGSKSSDRSMDNMGDMSQMNH